MKKIIAVLFSISTLVLTGCGARIMDPSKGIKSLDKEGYNVQTYDISDLSSTFENLSFEGFVITDAYYGYKGEDEFFLAFYFSKISEAREFLEAKDLLNTKALREFASQKNEEHFVVGTYNNIAYAGTETTYAIVF